MPSAEELILEANAAARLLNDELLNRVLEEIEQGYLEEFRSSQEPTDDRFYWQLHAVENLRNELRTKLDRGAVEARRLEDEERRREASRSR